ncbi:MAG TPA: glycosyltransferase [Streptosporangiaceae bacterium]
MRIALITAHGSIAGMAAPSSAAKPGALAGGGPALYPLALARGLADQGHRVTIYARSERRDGPETAILGRGVSVEYLQAGPARPLPDEQAARHMPEFATVLASRWRTRKPDVVHAFSWVSGLAALGAVRGLGIPVVQTFESLACSERQFSEPGEISASRARLEPAIGRSAAAVLVRSVSEASDLARQAVPKTAIRVVPFGVDTELFSPDGDRATRNARPRLVAFASPDETSGLKAIVRALSLAGDVELVVVGGPDSRHLPRSGAFREVAQLAASLRVRSRVTFAGEVAADQLPALLRSADVLVSATAHEPSAAAAVHAMACGTPAVVSAVGAHLDAVIDGTTGLLIPPDQPAALARRLRQLLATPALLEAYGIAAADRVRSRYSWDRIASETAAVYERCLRGAEDPAAAGDAEDEEEVESGALVQRVAALA